MINTLVHLMSTLIIIKLFLIKGIINSRHGPLEDQLPG